MDSVRPNHSPTKIWWYYVKSQWAVYIAGVFAMFLTNATEVLAPKTLQWMIDALFAAGKSSHRSFADGSFSQILRASFIFVGIAFLGLVGRVFWRFTLARMTHVAGNSMKGGLWDSLRSSSMENIARFTLGDLMNRAIGDVNSARWIYGFTLVLTCDVVFFTILGSVSMLLIHPGLALACLSTFIIIPPLMLRIARKEYAAHEAAQAELTTLSEHVSQAVRGVRAQRASGSFTTWVKFLEDSARRYSVLRLKAQTISINSFPLCSVPTMLSYVILFFWGPSLVTVGTISIGEFAALASYVYLLQGPLAEVGELVAEWQKGFSSLNRIAEIRSLSFSAENQGSLNVFSEYPTLSSAEGSLNNPCSAARTYEVSDESAKSLLDISELSCMRGGRLLFSDISFTLKMGEWLGLCGAVGCGKSTLLQNLAGLVPVSTGVLRYRGTSMPALRSLNSSTLGKREIAYAPEKPFVFAGTVRHNLSLSHNYTDEQLWQALNLVCLTDDVIKLAKGLDGQIGEGGVSLSGGQRQRLALARIILRASSVVILDDPLSAVDEETESRIVRNLREHWAEVAVIWSSNKVSTLLCCDRVAKLSTRGLDYQTNLKLAGVQKPEAVAHA